MYLNEVYRLTSRNRFLDLYRQYTDYISQVGLETPHFYSLLLTHSKKLPFYNFDTYSLNVEYISHFRVQ